MYLVKLWLFSRILFNTLVDVLLFIATVLFLKNSQSPFIATQGFNASTRKRFICRTVSLDDIKFIKNVTNATVNDVVLGITQAALSRYIYRRYEVEGKKKFSVQKMRCRATVAVNLRPALGVQAMVEMIEKNGTVVQGNCFGFALIPLSIAQLESPLDYVHKAKLSMDPKKHSLGTRCTSYILQLIFNFFGTRAAATVAGRVLFQTTVTFSNVAGPLEEVSSSGNPLTFLAATTSYGHFNLCHAVNICYSS